MSALKRPPAPLPSVPAGEPGSVVDRERRRGRGTLSNASGRYEPLARVAFDDGWQGLEDLPAFKTTVTADTTRKIITRNDSPDISFDRSINPYRGCEHGCVYCFARPTHAYLGLSPGLDFETKLFIKPTRPKCWSANWRRRATAENHRHRHQYRSVSADRAALQDHAPHPRSLGQRRPSGRHRHQIGARVARPRYPVAMAERDLVNVALSVTTLDANWRGPWSRARPRRPARRAETAQGGRSGSGHGGAGHPGLNDKEMERILEAAAAAGVRRGLCAAPVAVRVRDYSPNGSWPIARTAPPRLQADARREAASSTMRNGASARSAPGRSPG